MQILRTWLQITGTKSRKKAQFIIGSSKTHDQLPRKVLYEYVIVPIESTSKKETGLIMQTIVGRNSVIFGENMSKCDLFNY